MNFATYLNIEIIYVLLHQDYFSEFCDSSHFNMCQNSTIFKSDQYSSLCHILLNHSFTYGQLICFAISTVVNTAAVTAPAVYRGLKSRRKVKAKSEGTRVWRGEYRM